MSVKVSVDGLYSEGNHLTAMNSAVPSEWFSTAPHFDYFYTDQIGSIAEMAGGADALEVAFCPRVRGT
ncbi:MAG: hypothetical protein ACRDHZ_11290 [Ktedonobacteraceae bacterium]